MTDCIERIHTIIVYACNMLPAAGHRDAYPSYSRCKPHCACANTNDISLPAPLGGQSRRFHHGNDHSRLTSFG